MSGVSVFDEPLILGDTISSAFSNSWETDRRKSALGMRRAFKRIGDSASADVRVSGVISVDAVESLMMVVLMLKLGRDRSLVPGREKFDSSEDAGCDGTAACASSAPSCNGRLGFVSASEFRRATSSRLPAKSWSIVARRRIFPLVVLGIFLLTGMKM